jgi:hypothetical protein
MINNKRTKYKYKILNKLKKTNKVLYVLMKMKNHFKVALFKIIFKV